MVDELHGASMSTLGFFALVKDSPESQVNDTTHLNHISVNIVDLPENMRQLSWSIEGNMSLHKANLACGLQQARCT